jgi:hypothetical protein
MKDNSAMLKSKFTVFIVICLSSQFNVTRELFLWINYHTENSEAVQGHLCIIYVLTILVH